MGAGRRRCGVVPQLLVLALLGCGDPPVVCTSPEQVLAEGSGAPLTCNDAGRVQAWIELLAGRELQHNGAKRLPSAMVDAYTADADDLRELLADVEKAGKALEPHAGGDGARRRAQALWVSHEGKGPIQPSDGQLWSIQKDALAIWATADDDELALAEADIEGWLKYASWCREVQGGGVLRVSIADKVSAYKVLVDRFTSGDRDVRLALTAIGPFWGQIRDRWEASSYERQQSWIHSAPLPAPMTGNSLDYLAAVVAGDVEDHVATVHQTLGPFSLNRAAPVFSTGASSGELVVPADEEGPAEAPADSE